MFSQKKSVKGSLFLTLRLLVSLIVFPTVFFCNCSNSYKKSAIKKNEQSQTLNNQGSNVELNMEIFPRQLNAEAKRITVTFMPAGNTEAIDLIQYRLRIKLLQENGNSSLSYKNRENISQTIAAELEENLTDFFLADKLTPNETSLTIPFDIAPGTGVSSLKVVFELLDKNNVTLKECPIIWKKEAAIPVQLEIGKLDYDLANNRIICNIQNNGKETVEQVQLRYTNISQDNADNLSLINNQQQGIVDFLSIGGEEVSEDKIISIIFKPAARARFRFELLYRGELLKNVTEEREFNNKDFLLKLVAVGPTRLTGKDKTVQLKIEKNANSDSLDTGKLQLRVMQHTKSDACLQYNGKAIETIIGSELSVIGNNINLLVEPSTAVQASFKLYLLHEHNILDEQIFTWRMDDDQASRMLFGTVAAGDEEEIRELLQIPNININVRNENDETPLHEAVKTKNSSVIKLLLGQEDIQVNAKDKQGYTPLSIAVEQNSRLATLALLQAEGIDVDTKNKWGNSPLHLALQKDNQELVEHLIIKGANINAADNHGITPLHIATLLGKTKAVALLLAKGANKNMMDEEGNTPLHIATEKGKEQVLELLLATRANMKMIDKRGLTPLHKAALAGNKLAIQALLARKADVNAEDMHGNTPLHKAVEKGNREALGTLLAAKDIKLYAKDNDGSTPLHIAVLHGNEEAVTTLLDKGAKVDVKDKYDNMPLHIATQKGNLSITRKLLEKRVGINTKDYMGYTPLHMAVYYGYPAIVKLLLDKHAKQNIKDAQGETAVDLARRSTNIEIRKLFTKKSEDLNDRNVMGYTPLHMATYYNHLAITEFLNEKQAERNIEDEHEDIAVDLVVRSIDEEMKRLFAVTNP
jgi:ankyrin repeat protein